MKNIVLTNWISVPFKLKFVLTSSSATLLSFVLSTPSPSLLLQLSVGQFHSNMVFCFLVKVLYVHTYSKRQVEGE